jgi:hypothetical protein
MAKSKKGKKNETLKNGGEKPPNKPIAPDTIKKDKVYKRKWANQYNKLYEDYDIEKIADEMLEWFNKNKKSVHIVEFSTYKKIRRQTLYEWEKKNDYFAYCINIVRDLIIQRVAKHGFTRGNNAAFPIFYLVNISNGEFKNKQDITHSGSVSLDKVNLKSLTDDQLQKLRAMLQKNIPLETALLHIGVILD